MGSGHHTALKILVCIIIFMRWGCNYKSSKIQLVDSEQMFTVKMQFKISHRPIHFQVLDPRMGGEYQSQSTSHEDPLHTSDTMK